MIYSSRKLSIETTLTYPCKLSHKSGFQKGAIWARGGEVEDNSPRSGISTSVPLTPQGINGDEKQKQACW